jgi:hypothetical protein
MTTEELTPIVPICPIRKQPCAREPICLYKEDTMLGNTMCAEWVLKQQLEGRREHASKSQDTAKNRK